MANDPPPAQVLADEIADEVRKDMVSIARLHDAIRKHDERIGVRVEPPVFPVAAASEPPE